MAEKKAIAEAVVPMVKIKALRAVGIRKPDENGIKYCHVYQPGEVFEVTEDLAREYCDRSFRITLDKQIQFAGDIDSMRPKVVRAQRV